MSAFGAKRTFVAVRRAENAAPRRSNRQDVGADQLGDAAAIDGPLGIGDIMRLLSSGRAR